MPQPALTTSRATAPHDFDSGGWLSIAEAAGLLNRDKAHLRRLCAERWQPKGLARVVDNQWRVHRDAHPDLAEGAAHRVATDPAQFDQYTERQRRTASQRAKAVSIFRTEKASYQGCFVRERLPVLLVELGRRFPDLARNGKISQRSIYDWHKRAGNPIDECDLVDARGGDQKSQGAPQCWAFLRDCYLDERQPSLKDCWRRTKEFAAHEGLPWCSYQSCKRQLNDRIDVDTQTYWRNRKQWKSQFATYTEQHPERFAAGECWVGDHRPLDMLCRITSPDGERIVRPQLTLWQDWRTRKIVGWQIVESPDSTSILAALRMGLLDPEHKGGPSLVWIDNGKDFDCYSFHGQTKQQRKSRVSVNIDEDATWGLFQRLGIEAHWSIPHGPQGKARCERVFATVGLHFDRSFASYTGKTPDRKPEQLKDVIARAKDIPTFAEVRDRFRGWVAGYNANADHSMADLVGPEGKLSPAQAMQEWNTNHRLAPPAEALDDLLLHHHKPVSVGRNGIRLTISGASITFGQREIQSGELRRFRGTKHKVLCSYDPDDLSAIRVHDEQGRYVCRATANEAGLRHGDPARIDHVKRAQRDKNAHRKALKQERETYYTQYLSTEEMIAREANRPPEGGGAAGPVRADSDQPLKIVRTPDEADSTGDHKPPEAPPEENDPPRKVAGADPDEFRGIPDPTQFAAQYDHAATWSDEDEDELDVTPLEFIQRLYAEQQDDEEGGAA